MLRTLLILVLGLIIAARLGHGGQDKKCAVLIKVLDAVNGTPAANLHVHILRQNENQTWEQINVAVTGMHGEVHNLIFEEHLTAGLYKVHFETGIYWRNRGLAYFHECADVVFRVASSTRKHYTLAVLLSPYSYSTTGLTSSQH
ncbi:transthyretin [Narcine bancroftii]|uniref:transthyretin n=1 Tax=Narcine bancroftii TaxID=1343680 RepID=UPI003831F9F2